MFGIHDLPLFIAAGLLLNITPGPDMALFTARTLAQGPRAGFAALGGIYAGCVVHTLAAAIGLSAILRTSAEAFFVVKMIGAAYIVYVGISMLRERVVPIAADAAPAAAPLQRIFWQGCLTNVLNPKVALFYLAFLPQFIALDSPQKTTAFLLLGALFIVNSLLVTVPLVLLTARLRTGVKTPERFRLWLNRSCGALFIAVGVKLALSEKTA